MAEQKKQTQEQDLNHLLKVRREKLTELQAEMCIRDSPMPGRRSGIFP